MKRLSFQYAVHIRWVWGLRQEIRRGKEMCVGRSLRRSFPSFAWSKYRSEIASAVTPLSSSICSRSGCPWRSVVNHHNDKSVPASLPLPQQPNRCFCFSYQQPGYTSHYQHHQGWSVWSANRGSAGYSRWCRCVCNLASLFVVLYVRVTLQILLRTYTMTSTSLDYANAVVQFF